MKHKALIITGLGFNCEDETAYAWKLAGACPEKVHFNDLKNFNKYDSISLVGGFSYGDHISARKVIANKLKQLY